MRPLVIAIDGPSGAGKGTIARAVARELGYRHVDSGAMYRAVGWKAVRQGVSLDDEDAVAAIADGARIEVTSTHVTIDGTDVTREIRTPEIDKAAAGVARLPTIPRIPACPPRLPTWRRFSRSATNSTARAPHLRSTRQTMLSSSIRRARTSTWSARKCLPSWNAFDGRSQTPEPSAYLRSL